jgi:hypothetical protein
VETQPGRWAGVESHSANISRWLRISDGGAEHNQLFEALDNVKDDEDVVVVIKVRQAWIRMKVLLHRNFDA